MKRKDIKVGEMYGVVRRATDSAAPKVGATVLALDAEYRTMSRYGGTKHDGILVEFDAPVVPSYDSYEYLHELQAKAENYTARWLEDQESRAITRTVLENVRYVVGPWEQIKAAREDARVRREAQWAEALKASDEFEQRYEKLVASLRNIGLAEGSDVIFSFAEAQVGPGGISGRIALRDRATITTEALKLLALDAPAADAHGALLALVRWLGRTTDIQLPTDLHSQVTDALRGEMYTAVES